MSLAVDSSVWVDFLRGAATDQAQLLHKALVTRRIILGDLVYLEVMRGVADGDSARVRRQLEAYGIVAFGGEELAVLAAKHYALLRTKGVTVRKTIDMLIGTWCMVNRVPLLHSDRDFDPLEEHLGLQVWRG